jgi:transglutaminase-like putative cysteine protease
MRLAFAVADAIAYRPGVTHAHTTAAEALALGEGVCQDHAHALIACARVRGIPARYVSGYLFASEDGTPHEAAHAWAELHVPALAGSGLTRPTAAARMTATSGWARA